MLVGEGQEWAEGEGLAWETLSQIAPGDICHRALTSYNKASSHYILPLFNTEAFISPGDRRIWGESAEADRLLVGLAHYSRLCALWYLAGARGIPPSGTLINPREASGGLIFDMGSHALPLDRIVSRYSRDTAGFLSRGAALGGTPTDYGDASFTLHPFPRVPAMLVLWKEDDEFPARVDLLFDATCSSHLAPDMVWSTAMLTILAVLG